MAYKKFSKMRLKVEGVEDVLRALENADKKTKKALHDLISEAAEIVFREADARVPIKSGLSRETLHIEVGEDKNGRFYANVKVGGGDDFYITFYELGSSRQPPRPFMRPSLDKNRRKIRQHLIEGLKKIIK